MQPQCGDPRRVARRSIARFARRAVDQPAGLGRAHRLGQRPFLFRAVERSGRIVGAQAFCIKKTEELAQGRQLSRLRGCREAPSGYVGHVGADLLGPGGGKSAGNRVGCVIEIAAIGRQRVFGRAPLGAHHLQKSLDPGRAFHW